LGDNVHPELPLIGAVGVCSNCLGPTGVALVAVAVVLRDFWWLWVRYLLDESGARPPKLDEDEQDELVEMLRDGQPWKSQEIQHLLQEELGVSYSPNYLGTFLRELGLSYAKPRPKRPHRPENPDEILEERVDDALDEDDQPHNKREGEDEEGWIVEDDICTDGGTVLGFFDASKPPTDSSKCWPHSGQQSQVTSTSSSGSAVERHSGS